MCKTWMDRWQELEGAIIARLAIEDAKDLSDSELLRCFKHCATECLMSVTVPARDKGILLFESITKMREEMGYPSQYTLIDNTIPSLFDCPWCDAKVGDIHSRACPNGERYKQVQQLTASGKFLPEIIPGYIEIAWGEFTSSKVNAKDKRENKKGLTLEDI